MRESSRQEGISPEFQRRFAEEMRGIRETLSTTEEALERIARRLRKLIEEQR